MAYISSFSTLRHFFASALALTLAILVGSPTANAFGRGDKTLLIINSYHEDELWAARMAQPVELYLIENGTVRGEHVYLNNSSVTDMETFDMVCDNIFDRFRDNPPSYLVLIGNFAFTLRDRIVEEWGDIPMLLISRIETYAPVEQYFATPSKESEFDVNDQRPLGRLRSKYNFSAIIVPDFYSDNVELMMDLMPDMKEFVFISDKAYVNKVAAMNLEGLLSEMYPDVKFRWLQGDEANSEEMIDMLITPHPQTGLLLSSWVYEVENARGLKVLTTKDLNFINAAKTPLFSLRQLYMRLGAVGGVFADNDVLEKDIITMVDSMVNGADMHQIPFSVADNPVTYADYTKMKQFGFKFKDLPKGTIVLNRPESYFERYWAAMVGIVAFFIVAIGIVLWKNKNQRQKIAALQRHRDFINTMPLPYTKVTLYLDKDNNVININYEMKNNSYDELIAKNSMPDNPLHLFSNTYLSDIAKQLVEGGEPVSVRHHFKRTGLYCYMIFVPVATASTHYKKDKGLLIDTGSDSSRRLEVDVFAIDISKDQQMQQQLKDQAVTLDISMEMAQLVPWQWDAITDTISFYTYRNDVSANDDLEDVQKSSTAIKFEDFMRRMPDADAEEMMKIYHRMLRGETNRLDLVYRFYRPGSEEEYDWCENHGVVTDTDSDGRPLRMTGSVQFITDRKRQEEDMKQALTKAKESDMLKSAFLANMSHEIRTPLNAIVGFSNLLTQTDDMNERQEFAEIINRNNELLLSLINDILDLAKIESNTITLTYDLCDIHDVVDSISKTVSIRVPKGVKLNVAHYADSCVVKADAAHVSQILINLLTNATKFTKRGSITVGYEIIEDENKIYFYVKDTGIGIKKENIDKVFNRFVKLNNFVQGSGLGLAICRTLVEKMGGEIGVDSPGEGRGSMFWFTIPYDPLELKIEEKEREPKVLHDPMKAHDHIIGEHSDRPAKVESHSFEFKTASDISQNALSSMPDGLTVLVAEDNPSNYWLMARLMKDKFKLYHAENGKLAVDMFDDINPDIVVMDINMPEMDGYGAVEEMRKRGIKVPIIAVTAYAFASDRIRILNSGFDAFVSKPVSASILYDTIAEVWERKKSKTKDNNDNQA